ncbi:unnamed protein product [Auanema sp. JU1783]|nr:unnamed protein product [Auanema sp. JU1783]
MEPLTKLAICLVIFLPSFIYFIISVVSYEEANEDDNMHLIYREQTINKDLLSYIEYASSKMNQNILPSEAEGYALIRKQSKKSR